MKSGRGGISRYVYVKIRIILSHFEGKCWGLIVYCIMAVPSCLQAANDRKEPKNIDQYQKSDARSQLFFPSKELQKIKLKSV
jgi:hypothetical protein